MNNKTNKMPTDTSGMYMNIDAIELAKYTIDKCTKDGRPINNLQLQKILYFLFIDICKRYHKFLFKNSIVALAYGPIIFDVYKIYRDNGRFSILKEYDNIDLKTDKETMDILNKKIDELREIPTWVLICCSCKKNTAWSRALEKGAGTKMDKRDIMQNIKDHEIKEIKY